jgi:hypothetical protein
MPLVPLEQRGSRFSFTPVSTNSSHSSTQLTSGGAIRLDRRQNYI